jgi:uncharacterized repeat protein (TIGR01451 family)
MKLFNNHRRFRRASAAVGVLAAVAVGWAVATQTNVMDRITGKAYANPPAAACIKVTDGINVNSQNANATVDLDPGCGTHTFVLKAWYAPNALGGSQAPGQVLYAVTQNPVTMSGSTPPTKIHVAMFDPTCYYQVDLVDISVPNTGDGYPIVKAATGGNHDCRPDQTHAYACSALNLTPGDRKVTISNFQVATTNATFTGATINWGDGTSSVSDTVTGISHNYAAYGTYTVSVVADFVYKNRLGNEVRVSAPPCSAAVTFTPPVVKLTCDGLDAKPGDVASDGSQSYGFTTKTTAENTTVASYTYEFGDGSPVQTIPGATTSHSYAPGDYTASVSIKGADGQTVNSDACKAHITVKKPEAKLTCDSLTGTPGAIDAATGNQSFSFTAKGTPTNTTITGYTFDFGDSSDDQTIPGASTTHTYAPGDYTARVTVNAGDLKATNDKCTYKVHVDQKKDSKLVCTSLQLVPGAMNEDASQSFTLKATATPNNATITSYVFSFGDGSQDVPVDSDQNNASTTHTYAPGSYTATVTVKGKDAAGKDITAPANTACSQPVTVAPPQPKNPNISLIKNVDGVKSKSVSVNQNFTYQIVVKNTGEKDLTNVTVSDTAPSGVTFLSTDKGSVDGNKLTYTLEKLAMKDSVTINITAVIKAYVPGNVINTACVDTPDMEGNPDSCDTATVTVPPVVTPPTTTPSTPQTLGVTTLVNTGPGQTMAIAAAVVVISTLAHRLFLARKLAR